MRVLNCYNKKDRGVSPVIGVILMVAITVILAAVIGAFVLGLGENVEENVTAGINIDSSPQSIDIQWMNEGNSDTISVTFSVIDGTGSLDDGTGTATNEVTAEISSIGGSTSVDSYDGGGTETTLEVQVSVVAQQDNGAETVIQTDTVTLTGAGDPAV